MSAPARHAIAFFLPGLHGGGAERIVLNLAQGIVERGFSVDLVLASDEGHVRALQRLARTPHNRAKIRLVREFDPEAVAAGTLETSDPWYGGDDHFARCFQEVEAACHGILDHVREQLDREPEPENLS